MEQALTYTTHQAVLLHHEINLLDRFRRQQDQFNVDNRRSSAFVHNKKIDPLIRSKQDQLSVMLKYSDFPAMVVAAYKDAQLLDKSRYWDCCATIDKPVLVRGIANGKICDHVRNKG